MPAKKKKAAKRTGKAKGGRPRAEIDWSIVDGCCQVHCTINEIASILGVSKDTLMRATKRDHGVTFATYFEEKSADGKQSLRRKQFTTAMSGNVTMMIWLGKNWLGQSDSPVVATGKQDLVVRFVNDAVKAAEPDPEPGDT